MKLEDIKKLSDEEITIKVAKISGWKREPCNCGACKKLPPAANRPIMWCDPNGMWMTEIDHDYANDLNAIHEATKNLNELQRGEYLGNLYEVNSEERSAVDDQWFYLNATARQRAEAFILTMEK